MDAKEEFVSLLSQGMLEEAKILVESSVGDKHLFLAALGDHFLGLGDLVSSKRYYARSASEHPNAAAHFGLGSVLFAEGKIKDCVPFFSESAKSESHCVASLLKIGMAERLLGNIKGSLSAYLLAKSKGYDKFVLDVNIAILLSDLGEFDLAGSYYEKAISKSPDDPKTKFNYSLYLLSLGDFSKGLKYYEARPWCFRGFGKEWSGESGKNVLILSEQGHGDLIQFSRFISDVKKVSSKVALACDPSLISLVSKIGCVDEFFGLDDESIRKAGNSYPFYCRVMSIPFLMSLNPSTHEFSSITPSQDRVDFWKSRLANNDLLKVGICWQGGKRNDSEMIFNDKKRSVDLRLMEPILKLEGAEFYSLQKDWKEPHPKIMDLMGECGDFLDTASLISALDLVISVDTSVAHVAGSLDKPVWVLSRLGGCWRWGNSGLETFWYPSMKLFRQKAIDDWSLPINEIKESLAELLNVRYNCSYD